MRKINDLIMKVLIYLSTFITVSILFCILGYIFINGIRLVDLSFITREYNEKTYYLHFETMEIDTSIDQEVLKDKMYYSKKYEVPISEPIYLENIGGAILKVKYSNYSDKGERYIICYLDDSSNAIKAVDRNENDIGIDQGDIIKSVNGNNILELDIEEVANMIRTSKKNIEFKITKPGYGLFTNIITTVYMILLSLAIAAPIGILAAIYLVEYAKPGKMVDIIRFATESLSGIPSIIYGLFGMAFFVVFLNFHLSLLSGALTISIILLPVIIRSTEEALKAVPESYREASYGLGATKLQTISKIIIPSATPGILVAIVLSIGRIVGESAALLLTAGTVSKIPDSLFSSGSTLTVQAYYVAKEEANIEMACAIGVVVIILIIILNIIAKLISKIFNKANY